MPGPHVPGFARQVERIDSQLQEVEKAIEAEHMQLTAEVPGAEAEMVLVLETVGRIDNLVRAVESARIAGLEWLGDIDEYEIAPDEDFHFEAEEERGKPLGGRLYLVMSNRTGLRQLLALWKEFKENEGRPHYVRGLGRWRHVFDCLKEIRTWGVQDRLTNSALADWAERIRAGEDIVRVEIELWPRKSEDRRVQALKTVQNHVKELGGEFITHSYIEDIHYHGLRVKMPIAAVKRLVDDRSVKLVRCEDIMFFLPTGQIAIRLPDEAPLPATAARVFGAPAGLPMIAILDGLPLENHRLLAGRLIVDDPDGWSADHPAAQRVHGTAMASLILYGDLRDGNEPLARPLYIRPVLTASGLDERAPEDVLFVDLVHSAVRRMFSTIGDAAATAPTVRVINFSVGDPSRLFDGSISPLARLLDWLSTQFNVLFVVSAGNHIDDLTLNIPKEEVGALRADPARLRKEVLKVMCNQRLKHPLYSPAEAANVLTVGASHSDSSAGMAANPAAIDLLDSPKLPSPVTAQGPGFRRSVKPEILAPGGRMAYREKTPNSTASLVLEPVRNQSRLCGQRVATSGVAPGDLSQERLSCGTSNSAALATRSAGMLCEVLDSLRMAPGGDRLTREYEIPLLKALLVHSAAWGETGDLLWAIDGAARVKAVLTQLLGYGQLNTDRVITCLDERVTLLGFGRISPDQGHQFALPLPPSLNLVEGRRTLVSTLAWLTPINPKHNRYRRADLWFDLYGANPAEGSCREKLGVVGQGVDRQTSQRGTLQHEVLVGERAAAFADGEAINIQVNCRADAGGCDGEIPYGLVLTLEVEPEMGIAIYDEIAIRIRPPVQIAPTP